MKQYGFSELIFGCLRFRDRAVHPDINIVAAGRFCRYIIQVDHGAVCGTYGRSIADFRGRDCGHGRFFDGVQ